MKFKVGERYKVTGYIREKGNIIEIVKIVECRIHYKTIEGVNNGSNVFEIGSLFARCLKPVKSKKDKYIVIYRKDNTMVAIDKVTGEKAVAKCSPDDTFDYKVGAKLAFKRLMGEEEETGGNFKVLCVEDVRYGCCTIVFKTGKVYEYVNGHCKREDGSKSGNYADFAELIRCNPGYKGKLFEVKEVNRFAKLGEYVKVVHATGTCYEEYSNGDILRIVEEDEELNPNSMERAYYKNESKKYLDTCEYVVLEGDYPKDVNTIEVGDTVKVIDSGRTFDTYYDWSGLSDYKNNFIRRGVPEEDKEYKVLNLGTHDFNCNKELALIQNPNTKQVFIITVDGLEKC